MSLGALQKLPRELRDSIYAHLMPWAVPRDILGCRYRRLHRQDPPSLALLRSSRALYEEAACLLYHNWHLVIETQQGYYHSQNLGFRISHPTRGEVDLSCLLDATKPGTYCSKHAAIPYQRWRSITIEIWPMYYYEDESFLLHWRSMKVIAKILDGHDVPRIHFKVNSDKWCNRGYVTPKMHQFHSKHPWNDYQLLLLPLSHLSCNGSATRITFHGPAEATAVLRKTAKVGHLQEGDSEGTVTLEVSSLTIVDNENVLDPQSAWDQQEEIMDLYLDAHLDDITGEFAAKLQADRWVHWNAEYEQRLISTAALLQPTQRDWILSRLVERWAICRAMFPKDLDADLVEWYDTDPQHHSALISSIPALEELREERASWRWQCVSKGNYEDFMMLLDQLRYAGLFYLRRILVTPNGIAWDPDHTEATSNLPCRPRSDVLFFQDPPARPGRPPHLDYDFAIALGDDFLDAFLDTRTEYRLSY